MARPHRPKPRPIRPGSGRKVFRILITRTQYRVLDVQADNLQEAEDFAMELASDGGTAGWDDYECSVAVDPQASELPSPFKMDPDREKRVEKLQAPSGFRSHLELFDDDEDEDDDE